MKTLIVTALCLFSINALGQKHATTVVQCQADFGLWRAQIIEYNNAEAARMNNGVPDNTEVMKLSYNELNDRAYEMGQCAAIDQGQADSYNGVMADYVSAKNDRYKFYVERHKLKQAMLREDAAGKRTQ